MASKRSATEVHGTSKRKVRNKSADKLFSESDKRVIPESAQFSKLIEFERRIDAVITRKRLEIQNALKPAEKQTKTLRLFITGSWALTRPQDPACTDVAWTLRIEGKLLDMPRNKEKLPMTTFFKRVFIEFTLADQPSRTHEWSRTSSSLEADGYEITRTGLLPQKANILLDLANAPAKFKLPDTLAAILGVHTATKTQILIRLWVYIKQNSLLKADEPEIIQCDQYLQHVFRVPQMRFEELPAYIERCVLPADPIRIPYIFSLNPAMTHETKIFDLQVDVDIDNSTSPFLLAAGTAKQIEELDSRMDTMLAALNDARERRDVLKSFASDPSGFTLMWMASQRADETVVAKGPSIEHAGRRAEFYGEDWVVPSVERYLQEDADRNRLQLSQQFAAVVQSRQ
eukprot:TRINITY_DN2976_c0_g1_i1.p1 TRINITY_DN2976_c0_g1~~TRINITY_DN2976_c0_g1_i1.p1  ORF type:complete len:408 (+),score=58.24 TRINITY_DN2976_c0_g1_i1:22-1224(+)